MEATAATEARIWGVFVGFFVGLDLVLSLSCWLSFLLSWAFLYCELQSRQRTVVRVSSAFCREHLISDAKNGGMVRVDTRKHSKPPPPPSLLITTKPSVILARVFACITAANHEIPFVLACYPPPGRRKLRGDDCE